MFKWFKDARYADVQADMKVLNAKVNALEDTLHSVRSRISNMGTKARKQKEQEEEEYEGDDGEEGLSGTPSLRSLPDDFLQSLNPSEAETLKKLMRR